MKSFRIAVSVCALLGVAGPLLAADDPAAATVLHAKGLNRGKQDVIWATAAETEFHAHLDALRKSEAAYRTALAKFQTDLNAAQVDRINLEKAQREYTQLGAWLDNPASMPPPARQQFGGPNRLQIEIQNRVLIINDLQQKILVTQPQVDAQLKRTVLEISKQRDLLILAILAARAEAVAVEQGYGPLKDDAAVAAALKTLGGRHKLGPKTLTADKKALKGVESTVLVGEAFSYLSEGKTYVAGLLNEKLSVVFYIDAVNEGTLSSLPAATLEAAGVVIEPTAPVSPLTANGLTMQVRHVRIPTLRIGKYVLKDIPCLALPPEGDGLGFRVDSKLLEDYEYRLDKTKGSLSISRRGGDLPEEPITAQPSKQPQGEQAGPSPPVAQQSSPAVVPAAPPAVGAAATVAPKPGVDDEFSVRPATTIGNPAVLVPAPR